MKVLHLHPGADTAGQGMAAKAALEAAGDEVRVFSHSHHKFGYPRAAIWDDEAVRESYRWADVVVLHNEPSLLQKVANGGHRPLLVVHHHGSRFRAFGARYLEEGDDIGARQVVSTVDLLLAVPRGAVEWLPQVIDVRQMQAIRELHRPAPGTRLRVSHAPTNKAIKGTRWVQRASRQTREADLVLIQHQPWSVCLAMKAATDLFVDQLNLGYGNNAVEAWAMGLPVVAGATPPVLERMREEFGGELPFVEATGIGLPAVLKTLLRDEELRAGWAERGMRHVERFHAQAAWVDRARALYTGDRLETAA